MKILYGTRGVSPRPSEKIEQMLREFGEVVVVQSPMVAYEQMRTTRFDLIVADVEFDLIVEGVKCIILTRWGSLVGPALMGRGAYDYVDRDNPGVRTVSALRSSLEMILKATA